MENPHSRLLSVYRQLMQMHCIPIIFVFYVASGISGVSVVCTALRCLTCQICSGFVHCALHSERPQKLIKIQGADSFVCDLLKED